MGVVSGGRRYRVIGTLGKGGFGTVYAAELLGDGGFKKTVALKVLNPDVSGITEVAVRLRDEARVLGLIHHRAIVQVDALVRLDGRWAVVMEHVDGVDLKHVIRDGLAVGGGMPMGAAAEIIGEVAGALHQAWVQPGPDGEPLRMLHRDIKPSNLQLTANGEVKILDFGTARANFAAREAQTRSLAFGTIAYMAPERLEFTDLPAGDIYALGSVFFELLTGEPLGRTSAIPTRHEAFHDNAQQRLEELGVDPEARALVMAMLAYDPEDRPDARTVAQACRLLRQACPELWLADWAVDVVPALKAAPSEDSEAEAGSLTGKVLTEEQSGGFSNDPDASGLSVALSREPVGRPASPPPMQAPVAPPASSPEQGDGPGKLAWLIPAALVGFVASAAVGAALVVGMGLFSSDEASELGSDPTPEVIAEGPPSEPEPPVDMGRQDELDAGQQALEDESPPVYEAASEDPAPAPPPKSTRVRVSLSGDADEAVLISSSGRRHTLPASVSPASYTVEATFEGRGTVQAGSLVVRSGGSHSVACQRAFMKCQVQ